MILDEPRIEVRRSWIDRWRMQDEKRTEQLEQEIKRRWNENKKKA